MAEDDDYTRTIRLGSIYKQILETTPFDKGCKDLIKDPCLLRYLILCLPLNEMVIENILMSLMFKLQNNLYFLRMVNRTLVLVFKLKEHRVAGIDAQSQKRKVPNFNADPKQQDHFKYFAEKVCPMVVQMNFLNIKLRCLEYLRKIMKLLELVGTF